MATNLDLSKLNDSETAALRMLAGGHTIKTIAASLGASEGAINERLRAARRKSGVGSSRELARLFVAQENRDEFSVIAAPQEKADFLTSSESDANPRRVLIGGIAMLVVLGIVAASVVGLGGMNNEAKVALAADHPAGVGLAPAIRLMADEMMSDKEFKLKFDSETRDTIWADAAEKKLRESYEQLFAQHNTKAEFRFQCRRTLCQVDANFEVPIDKLADENRNETMRKTMGMWQLHVLPTNEGLKNVGTSLTTDFKKGRGEIKVFWMKDERT